MAGPKDVVGSAASGFLSLFSASLIAKLFTFASTVVIARTVGRAVLGVGTLQLDELLFLGPLVMTRDGLRKVAYRVDDGSADAAQSLVNMCWVTVPVAMGLGLLGARSLWLNRTPTGPGEEDDGFGRAIAFTLLALALAMVHEPAYLLAQSRMDQGFRAKGETLSTLAKCVVMVAGVVALSGGVVAFAAGNVGYAGVLCVLYIQDFFRTSSGGASLLPRRTSQGNWWLPQLLGPAREFWMQSLQKWVLENGEKVVMVFFGSDEQAGEYALVSNLGSIVVRLLFQPLEEMALATFGKLQMLVANGDAEKERKAQAQRTMHQAFSVLIRMLLLLGLLFACFGPAYSHLLLHLLYGSTWSDTSAPLVLAWYCSYIMSMAVNGLCEAFVQGVATEEQLRTYNYCMVGFSISFLLAVMVLMPYGAVGIVVANILKMVCRIVVCVVWYIVPALAGGDATHAAGWAELRRMLPAPGVLAAFAVSLVSTQASSRLLYRPLPDILATAKHVAVGAACLVITCGAIWRSHGRAFVRDIKELRSK